MFLIDHSEVAVIRLDLTWCGKSNNVHVLILGNFEYAILHGNREFRLQMELRLLVSWGEIGRLSWIIWVCPHVTTGFFF